ncbi:MAG: FkbM family methyltransferase [Cyclobacteriaceae bacterium]|nr:FkbM family methyltransferase [Cyclobacteriaceae bacterium]
MRWIKKFLIKIFARRLYQPFFQKLHWVALKGMNYGSANSPDDSGEAQLLTELAEELPREPVIFDVGANTGQYTRLLLKKLSSLKPIIYLFEPDPDAYAKLVNQFGDNKMIRLNNFALGEQIGIMQLYSYNKKGVEASLIKSHGAGQIERSVKVETIDNFCKYSGIEKIHFIKIDTEGYEISVIRGAIKMLDDNSIERIQLEHGSMNSIIIGSSLYQFMQILSRFKIFHIKQDGKFPLDFEPRFEIYYNSNYYFKLKSQSSDSVNT